MASERRDQYYNPVGFGSCLEPWQLRNTTLSMGKHGRDIGDSLVGLGRIMRFLMELVLFTVYHWKFHFVFHELLVLFLMNYIHRSISIWNERYELVSYSLHNAITRRS